MENAEHSAWHTVRHRTRRLAVVVVGVGVIAVVVVAVYHTDWTCFL